MSGGLVALSGESLGDSGDAATERHRNAQKNHLNRHADSVLCPSVGFCGHGSGPCFPARFVLPGGVKGDIILW